MSDIIILKDKDSNPVNLVIKKNSHVKYQGGIASEHNFIVEEGATLEYVEFSPNLESSNLKVELLEYSAKAYINVLAIGKNKKATFNQVIEHKALETYSNVNNFAIALDNSNLDFKTVGHIANKMAKSNCRQLCRGIIIGNDSTISSEPILLIDEYDVFASHGAAIGKMSDEEMFYLMSRGLTKEESLKLIIEGLIRPFIDKLEEKEETEILINKMIRGE